MKTINLLSDYEELKRKYGTTDEFKKFEERYGFDIEFLRFKKKNGLKYSKKHGWNKPFSPIIETIWIKDRKNWNKGLRKFGYYQNIMVGWRLGGLPGKRCLWCGKFLTGKQTKFCTVEPKDKHKKLFSKVINIGKKRHGFDMKKNNHILIIPRLYNYVIDQTGRCIEYRNEKERIEFKDIAFVINGNQYPLTAKSRTIISET